MTERLFEYVKTRKESQPERRSSNDALAFEARPDDAELRSLGERRVPEE